MKLLIVFNVRVGFCRGATVCDSQGKCNVRSVIVLSAALSVAQAKVSAKNFINVQVAL